MLTQALLSLAVGGVLLELVRDEKSGLLSARLRIVAL